MNQPKRSSLLSRLVFVVLAFAVLVGFGTGLGSLLDVSALGVAIGFALWLVIALPGILLKPQRDSRQSLKSFLFLGRSGPGGAI